MPEERAKREAGYYRLRRRYWDNERMHEPGTVLQFPEGKAPSTAVKTQPRPAVQTVVYEDEEETVVLDPNDPEDED